MASACRSAPSPSAGTCRMPWTSPCSYSSASWAESARSWSPSAYRYADTSVIAPFEYTTMIWALLFGWFLFGDLPAVAVLVGAAIVAATGLFYRLARASARPPAHQGIRRQPRKDRVSDPKRRACSVPVLDPPVDYPTTVLRNERTFSRTEAVMGVEGKERSRELETGAQVLSGNMGKTIQRLRKAYNLSLSELAEQSGVAKSIISQIERNETNPTLATIWRLARPSTSRSSASWPPATKSPSSRSRPRPTRRSSSPRTARSARHHRLDQDHRMAAMVRRAVRARRRARFRQPPARLGRMPVGARGRVRGRGRRRDAAGQSRRKPALPLRPPPLVRCIGNSPGRATMVCILKAAVMD